MTITKEISYGAFGRVFELDETIVLKAFTTVSNSHLESSFYEKVNANDLKIIRYNAFLKEKKSYEIISKNEEIKKYFPIFFKEADPIKIIKNNLIEKDINKIFIENAGLILENIKLINQKEIKYTDLNSENPHYEKINDILQKAKELGATSNYYDCSILYNDKGFKIIDFSDGFPCHLFEEHLRINKSFDDEIKQFLINPNIEKEINIEILSRLKTDF